MTTCIKHTQPNQHAKLGELDLLAQKWMFQGLKLLA